MFCLSLNPSHYNFINNLGYTPVGLGEKDFSKEWFTDKPVQKFPKKIDIIANAPFITGYGKIILINSKMDG